MKNVQFFFAGLLCAGMLVVTACGSGAAAASGSSGDTTPVHASESNGTQQITLTISNRMSFEPSTLVVRAGEPVEVTLDNEGTMPHDFTLSTGAAAPVTIAAAAEQTATGSFTLSQAGTYSFECSIPGHAAAGMRGTITAE
jgi:nitrite reductase (NO-forming)